jgi:hypothetical protein
LLLVTSPLTTLAKHVHHALPGLSRCPSDAPMICSLFLVFSCANVFQLELPGRRVLGLLCALREVPCKVPALRYSPWSFYRVLVVVYTTTITYPPSAPNLVSVHSRLLCAAWCMSPNAPGEVPCKVPSSSLFTFLDFGGAHSGKHPYHHRHSPTHTYPPSAPNLVSVHSRWGRRRS